jgi:putative phage-type endonuclease
MTKNFIVHDLQQGSQEWLDFRKGKVGASDVASILEMSPWETKLQCWERFISGASKQKNASMQRGTDLEPEALSAANAIFGGDPFRPVVLQSVEFPDLIASLDGYREWMGKREILEIKCPGEKDHSCAEKGIVPEKYYPQLQHQMWMANVPYAIYFSYGIREPAIVKVLRDETFIAQMIDQELQFLKDLRNWTRPEPRDSDWIKIDDPTAIASVEKYFQIDCEIKSLESRREEIKEFLKILAKNPRSIIGNARLQKVDVTGHIDTKKAMLDGIDLEKYRKPPFPIWRLTLSN